MSSQSQKGDEWGRSVRGGVLWSTTTFVASKSLNFLTLVVLARILVPGEFGVVAAISAFVTFLQLGATLGLRATMVYEQEQGITPRVQTAFTLNLVLVVAFTAGGVLLAPFIASFFGVPEEVGLFRLGVLSLLIVGLGSVHDGLLLRGLEFNRRIVPEVARGVASGVTSIVLAVLGFGAVSLVVGLLAGSAAWTTAQWMLTRFRPTFVLDRAIARSMLVYGLGASMLEVVAAIAQRADIAVIGHFLGNRALGIYTIGFRIPELVVSNVAWNVSLVAFPALARRRATDSESGLAAGSLDLLRFQALYALPVASGLAVLAPSLVVVVFSDRWAEAGGVMSAIAVMVGISSTIFPLGDVFKATGRQSILIGLNILLVPLLIVTIILAAPQGVLTIAWIRVGVTGCFAALFLIAVHREIKVGLRPLLRALRPGLAAAGGVVLASGGVRVGWGAEGLGPLVVAAVSGAIGAVAALRVLDAPMFSLLRDMITEPLLARRQRRNDAALVGQGSGQLGDEGDRG